MSLQSRQAAEGRRRFGALVMPREANRVIIGTAGALIFSGLILLGANIRIPLHPVPITLQTLFVLLSGAILRSGFGTLSSVFYLGMGCAGLPVFAGGVTGAGVIGSPTGGYLLGFLAAPLIVGHLIQRHNSVRWHLFVFTSGTFVIITFGLVHLTLLYTHDFTTSLHVGLLPFVPGDLLKIIAAGSIYRTFTAIRRYRSTR